MGHEMRVEMTCPAFTLALTIKVSLDAYNFLASLFTRNIAVSFLKKLFASNAYKTIRSQLACILVFISPEMTETKFQRPF